LLVTPSSLMIRANVHSWRERRANRKLAAEINPAE